MVIDVCWLLAHLFLCTHRQEYVRWIKTEWQGSGAIPVLSRWDRGKSQWVCSYAGWDWTGDKWLSLTGVNVTFRCSQRCLRMMEFFWNVIIWSLMFQRSFVSSSWRVRRWKWQSYDHRNIRYLKPDNTASHPKRPESPTITNITALLYLDWNYHLYSF